MSSSSSSLSPADQLLARRARQIAAEASNGESSSAARASDDSSDEEAEQQLRSAHAQSHNPVDDLLPSPTRSPPRAMPSLPISGNNRTQAARGVRAGRTVTVNDIKNRTCWICSDGDDGDFKAPSASRRWVHPCKCSLVAHETCLLTWIRSRRSGGTPDPNRIITCPQCSHPYTIVERKPLALHVFEFGDGVLRSIVPVASAGVLGGGLLVAATAYGCTAIRLWMGEKATRRTLSGKWPWHFYFDIPLIPIALILSRLRFLDRAMMWLPTLVAFPITHVPMATLTWTHPYAPVWTWRQPQGQVRAARVYPPGPALTILLVPWVRMLYLTLKRRITRSVLSGFVRKSSGQTGSSSQSQRRRSETRRHVIVVGQEQHVHNLDLVDVAVDEQGQPRELPPGADAVEQGPPDQTQGGDEEEGNDEAGEEATIQQTIYVTPQSLGRLCLGALSTPLVANVMGKLLAKIAGYSYWLRAILGMQLRPTAKSLGASLAEYSSRKGESSRTPLGNLFSTGSPKSSDMSEEERMLYTNYDDLDPVWFRNALGAGICIVVKDIVQLSYRYLRLTHAREGSRRTNILDRPFEGSMVDELDLREK